MDTSGSDPKTTRLAGATPIWAPMVTAIGAVSHSGPGSNGHTRGAITVTPAVAPTDSQKPTDHASNGSTSTSAPTAITRMRAGGRSRPSSTPTAAMPAITPARNTDGSNRVRARNQTMVAMV